MHTCKGFRAIIGQEDGRRGKGFDHPVGLATPADAALCTAVATRIGGGITVALALILMAALSRG
ncbi:hypothetical protein DPM13_12405 [Paracoccus mutanolyticus]|uniref:Cobalamin biosynthesis protein n=1 Tax=Paracoccus mutanolyticus TaxID=1499308 RepID=A0ABM6WSJ5_9RHOB|nr:hypothetical protein [Paracoccus mutanolyticus]AWX93617.1 hypothetical protein DPM13_12405 [Paracoccus mutanolyticus]